MLSEYLEMKTGYPDGGPSLYEETLLENIARQEEDLSHLLMEKELVAETLAGLRFFPAGAREDVREHYAERAEAIRGNIRAARESLQRVRERH